MELFLEKYQQSVMNIEFINEGEEPLGTAGAIFNIIDGGLIKDEQFRIVNADIMTSFSFKSIWGLYILGTPLFNFWFH